MPDLRNRAVAQAGLSEPAQCGGLRFDQRAGQVVRAHLGEPDGRAVGTEDLDHRLAISSQPTAHVQAQAHVGVQFTGQVGLQGVQAGCSGDADPVPERQPGRAGRTDRGAHCRLPQPYPERPWCGQVP